MIESFENKGERKGWEEKFGAKSTKDSGMGFILLRIFPLLS